MRNRKLHLVGGAPAGVRGENGDAVGCSASSGVLRGREDQARGCLDAAPAGRGESTVGQGLSYAGWFWVGYAGAVVLTVAGLVWWR